MNNWLVSWLVTQLKNEVLLVVGAIAALIVFVAGHYGIVLDKPTVTGVVAPFVTALVGRFHVTPVSKIKSLLAARSCSKPDCPNK